MNTAVFIGRFQPPHLAHLQTITQALARFDQLIVVLGSAYCYPTPKNPFSAEAREAMIRASLPSDQARLQFVAIVDEYYNDPRWFRSVRAAVEALAGPQAQIRITGYDKDQSSYYLHGFENWPFEPSGVVSSLSATDVRNSYFGGSAEWRTMVPGAVAQYMQQFAATAEFKRLKEEWEAIQYYRSLERHYPYPILHVATHATVLAQQQVLLIERKGPFGQGAWALPGGYVAPKETLLESALRKLREETGLRLEAQHLRASQAFDYPERSLRGRVISLGHFFDLGDAPPPAVQGQNQDDPLQDRPTAVHRTDDPLRDGTRSVHQTDDPLGDRPTAVHQMDDPLRDGTPSVHHTDDPLRDRRVAPAVHQGTTRAFWLPLAELDRYQARFFEDHYQQICWFLGRAPHQPALLQGKEFCETPQSP